MTVIWWNGAGALTATIANLYGYRQGDPRLRPLRATIAALAAFYLLGYILVGLNMWPLDEWGAFYRKASIVVWPIVWAAPAVLGARSHQRTMRALKPFRGDP